LDLSFDRLLMMMMIKVHVNPSGGTHDHKRGVNEI